MADETGTEADQPAAEVGRERIEERLAALERLLAAQQAQFAAQREEMERRLAVQRDELAAQREELASLRTERADGAPPAPSSPLILPAKFRGRGVASADESAEPERANGRRASRRGLLKLGGVAAAAGLAAGAGELLHPGAARAAGARPEGSQIYNSVTGPNQAAFFGQGFSGGNGINGFTDTSFGVWGDASDPTGIGVRGSAANGQSNAYSNAVVGDTRNGGNGYGIGVAGQADHGWGVYGTSSNDGIGVEGDSVNGRGVVGSSTNANGVWGNSVNAAGIAGVSTNWTGGYFTGPEAQIELVPNAGNGPPTSGQHYHGMIYVDGTATMWLCTVTGNPGTWVRMAAVPHGTLGGAVNLLPVAARLLDTRGGSPVAYHATVQFNAGGAGGIPTNATAVLGHLAAGPRPGVSCGDGSSAILWPAGQTRPGAVNIVFNNPVDPVGQCLTGTLTLVAIGAGGQISLFSQPILPAGIDYLFDAFGYVM